METIYRLIEVGS